MQYMRLYPVGLCSIADCCVEEPEQLQTSVSFLYCCMRCVWQHVYYALCFRQRQVALINRLCPKMRIIQHKLRLSPCTTEGVHHAPSLPEMYVTFPYVLPADKPREHHLNSQILSFLPPSNYQHLSEGFICSVPSVCVSPCAQRNALSCTCTAGLVLSYLYQRV